MAPADIAQLTALYNAGRYAELESRTLILLSRLPDFGFAWQLLGAARKMQGKDGLYAFQKTVELMPDDAVAHSNLGAALTDLGRFDEAVASYRRALALDPVLAEAHFNLGNALKDVGQNEAAAKSYRRALELQADWSEAHNSLGAALENLRHYAGALVSFQRAVELKPDNARAHVNLGGLLQKTGQFDAAAESYERALALKPDHARAWSGLGAAMNCSGRYDEALPCLRRAVELDPASAANHFNLGLLLYQTGQLAGAEQSYWRALEINPDLTEAHNNLGVCLRDLGRIDEGLASCRRALELQPDSPLAHNNLGLLCKDTGRLDEAIAAYRRAVDLDPDYMQAHSALVYMLGFHPAYDEQGILAEARQFAAAHCPPQGSLPARLAGRDAMPNRRLRIGYISPDFRDHCQSLFTVPLLSHHDRERFEIFCYADLARPDAISERLATCADAWRATHLKSDMQVAEMIAADGIDILVDLTMHMANGRPGIFAMKPAPVQVAWLAYPGTTGLPAMDYRLTDPWLDPPERGDEAYSEASIRLPDTFWCYDPLNADLQPNPLPALTAGRVTFGCLNNFCKVSDGTLARWGQVMARVPSSRLILLAVPGSHRQRIFDSLARFDVAAARIEFVGHQPREHYLRTYHRIDFCLDTLPYNGHTTSLDACWMGVPVVTQVGHTVVGRAGWSQLNNLGHPELAAFDDQVFIDIAVALATDLSRLSQLRRSLRAKMAASPLMDAKRFTRAIEAAYLSL